MNEGSWPQWQVVAVTGLVVIFVYGATVGLGTGLARLLGLPSLVGALAGLVAGYVLASRMLGWVLQHTVMRDD